MRSIVVAGALFVIACGGSTAEDVASSELLLRGVSCAPTTDPANAQLAAGIVDVGAVRSYKPTLIVENKPLSSGVTAGPVTITGVSVRILDINQTPLASFTSAASGTLDSATNAPTYTTLQAEIIDATTTAAIAKRLGSAGTVRALAMITINAKTASGAPLQSKESMFPIDVCVGCLAGQPACAP